MDNSSFLTTNPDRSTPVANKTFRGAMLMGITPRGPQLLMIAKDYDETRLRLDKELGPSQSPLGHVPAYPWFFRRRSWNVDTAAKTAFVGLRLMQPVEDTPNFDFNTVVLIEIDFDAPLHPNNL